MIRPIPQLGLNEMRVGCAGQTREQCYNIDQPGQPLESTTNNERRISCPAHTMAVPECYLMVVRLVT